MSVIIPARNAATTLSQQLDALAGQTYRGDWEVIVADNGSTDGTRALALGWKDRLPSLRVVDAAGPANASFTRNAGVAAAEGDLLLFCDADDVVGSGWVEAMAEAARSADVIAGSLEVSALNSRVPEGIAARALGEARVKWDFLPFALGANVAVRRTVFMALGRWDLDYGTAAAEDVDLSWRAQLEGYVFAFAPDAVVHYRLRRGLRALARQRYAYGVGDVLLYQRFRNHGIWRAPAKRVIRDWAGLIRHLPYLVRGERLRAKWVRMAAYRLGCLVGSLRYRVLFLTDPQVWPGERGQVSR